MVSVVLVFVATIFVKNFTPRTWSVSSTADLRTAAMIASSKFLIYNSMKRPLLNVACVRLEMPDQAVVSGESPSTMRARCRGRGPMASHSFNTHDVVM